MSAAIMLCVWYECWNTVLFSIDAKFVGNPRPTLVSGVARSEVLLGHHKGRAKRTAKILLINIHKTRILWYPSLRGGTTCFRYVTRKRIITNIPIAHVIHRLYAGFLTDRHWTVVRNLKLRRGLLIVQLKASSILVQFIENDRNKV